jgi:hypothetical protein
MRLNKMYSKVHVSKTCLFLIQNGLKEGDALSPLLLDFVLQFAIRKAQENQLGLKLVSVSRSACFTSDKGLLVLIR